MWVVVCAFACDPLLTHTGPDSCSLFFSSPVICDVIFSVCVWGKKNKHTSIGGLFERE